MQLKIQSPNARRSTETPTASSSSSDHPITPSLETFKQKDNTTRTQAHSDKGGLVCAAGVEQRASGGRPLKDRGIAAEATHAASQGERGALQVNTQDRGVERRRNRRV